MNENILKISKHFNAIGNEFKKMGSVCTSTECSIKETHIIEFLASGKKTMSELATNMNLTPGSMTTAIDVLIEKKYVKRENDENDRRKVYITLTKKGEKFASQIMENMLQISEKILEPLNKKEQATLIQIMDKVTENL